MPPDRWPCAPTCRHRHRHRRLGAWRSPGGVILVSCCYLCTVQHELAAKRRDRLHRLPPLSLVSKQPP